MFTEVKTEYFLVHGIHTATAYSKHPHIHTHIKQQLDEGQLSIFITSQRVSLHMKYLWFTASMAKCYK